MDTKQTPPWEKAKNDRAAVAKVFQKILDQKTWDAFNAQNLRIRKLYISERPGVTGFSDAFLESMFPRSHTPAEVYHYVLMPVFQSIVRTSEMRMYAAEKWIHEGGELLDFARDHNLQGYLQKDECYKVLANDLFCLCTTRDLTNEAYCWSMFGGNGTGVRLKLRLSPRYAQLRPIQYAASSRTLLIRLNEALKAEGFPPFVPWSISMIGGFYLKNSLSVENETRLLAKRHLDAPNHARSDGQHEYWPLPINAPNGLCQVEILEIKKGALAAESEIRNVLNGTALESVPVL